MAGFLSREERILLGVKHGLSHEETERRVNEQEHELRELLEMRCPSCKATDTLTRTLDDRQVGGSAAPGFWFNYRCPCGYMSDMKEEM